MYAIPRVAQFGATAGGDDSDGGSTNNEAAVQEVLDIQVRLISFTRYH